jgi:hypothetical protein
MSRVDQPCPFDSTLVQNSSIPRALRYGRLKEDCNVIRTLVSIEVDLASSLAIRFACHLGGCIDMEIHPVYVKGSPTHETAMGAGWASRTWEREIIEQGKEEIAQLIAAETDFCPVLSESRVAHGDRGIELLKILEETAFDLFVEGVHFPWTAGDIHRRLHGKLYQKLSSPLVLVRSLRKVSNVLLLCTDVSGTQALSAMFSKIWQNCSLPLLLAYPSEETSGAAHAGLREAVHEAGELLAKSGCAVTAQDELLAGPGDAAGEVLKQYSLVAMGLEKGAKKESAEFQWLQMVQTSALVALYSK